MKEKKRVHICTSSSFSLSLLATIKDTKRCFELTSKFTLPTRNRNNLVSERDSTRKYLPDFTFCLNRFKTEGGILFFGLMKMSGRFDIEKFDGKMSFAWWQVRMLAILSSHGVKDAIFGRDELSDAITDKKWRDMDDKSLSIVQL